MSSIRRMYVYLIAGLSLAFLLFGLTEVLRTVFEITSDWVSGVDVSAFESEQRREDLALYGAIVVVALPIWLLHWWMARRALRGPDGEKERQSLLRAIYFAVFLTIAVVLGFPQLIVIIRRALDSLFNVSDTGALAEPIATVLVLGAVWAFQVWNRLKDVNAGPLRQPASWPVRLYTYLALLLGAIILIVGLINLVNLPADFIYQGDDLAQDQWWQQLLIDSIAGIAVGSLIWGSHWWYTRRLATGATWQAAPEQRSVLRRGYLYLMVSVGVIGALIMLIVALQQPLEYVFGLLDDNSSREILQDIFQPLLTAGVFGLVWLFHRRQIIIEAGAYAEDRLQASIRRLYLYLMAAIGLAFSAVSVASLIGVVLDTTFGDGQSAGLFNDPWREEVSQFLPAAVVGVGVWLWQWRQIHRWMSTQSEVERNALTRRIYLYTVLAVAVVAVLVNLSILVYRLLTILLSVEDFSNFSSNLGTILGILVVATAILVYHGWLVWNDVEARSEAKPAMVSATLTLSAPAGSDLDVVVDRFRAQLDEGYTLNRQ